MNYLKYAVSVSCSKVVDRYTVFVSQFFNRFYVTYCQIYYVNVITYTGSIRCIIIVTEYTKTL